MSRSIKVNSDINIGQAEIQQCQWKANRKWVSQRCTLYQQCILCAGCYAQAGYQPLKVESWSTQSNYKPLGGNTLSGTMAYT